MAQGSRCIPAPRRRTARGAGHPPVDHEPLRRVRARHTAEHRARQRRPPHPRAHPDRASAPPPPPTSGPCSPAPPAPHTSAPAPSPAAPSCCASTPTGKPTVLADFKENNVQALAALPDGSLLAATSPDGKVYRIPAAGLAPGTRPELLFDAATTAEKPKYLWSLAVERTGDILVAAGAPADALPPSARPRHQAASRLQIRRPAPAHASARAGRHNLHRLRRRRHRLPHRAPTASPSPSSPHPSTKSPRSPLTRKAICTWPPSATAGRPPCPPARRR